MMGGMSVAAAESLFELLLLTFVVLVLTICIFILILKQLGFIKKINKKINFLWIWTQIIPIWSFVAIPITLIKINKQVKAYLKENNLENTYKPSYGWIWFLTSIISLPFSPFLIISLISFILFYKHLEKVENSLLTLR
ncbi:hypothetical protein CP985_09470 [Malaciobacter mytili LMG 24559]|uniref:Uncharacterized protein n=1 Tax=Malaciobacter mytili LMG 24559 TaxID=1032238 RepID=A0AAX2AEZ1_9BACT|nr:hypothetical protein [Malaciobacter mytili]AXH13998.1 putative membrane protein [Malaciobacter mytili LMG 24559]RXK15284.1 hypothetical protein CP985_09470 [Malaciobacter mytili LMG 24559]